jgi:hypothetical protein
MECTHGTFGGSEHCEKCKIKRATSNSALSDRVIPPQLAEVLRRFPLREPDRIVEGPNGETLAEWHGDDNYFEIECTPEGELEIMSQLDCETNHWTLK